MSLFYGNQSFLHLLGMRIKLLVIFVFFIRLIGAQTMTITPVKYHVNSLYDRTNGAKYACDKDGRFQDELVFYTIKQKDTVILFKSAVYNSCLKGLSEWFNADGHLIRQTINYDGGCTVHASSHQFMITRSLSLNLNALIEKSTFWDNYPPYSKEVEEFYTDGLLSKRINYYKNGKPFKVVHYALKNNYRTSSYAREYDKYEESGPYIQYNENGSIARQGEKRANKYTGTWHFYSEAGILETEKHYFNPDSVFITHFYPSGAKKSQETQWLEHKIGEDLTFYETGELESKKMFSKYGRQLDSEINYYKSGKIMEEIPCCGTFKTGTYKKWFENGKLAEKYNLVESYNRGKYEAWHENGMLKAKGQYDTLGFSAGKWYTYNEKGKLVSVRDFDKEIMEVPEVISEDIVTYAENPIADYAYSEFTQRLANSYLFGKSTEIPRDLRFLRKLTYVEIKASLTEKGIATFEILTALSSKQKEKLLAFLNEKVSFDGGFKIGYTNVPCWIIMSIEIDE